MRTLFALGRILTTAAVLAASLIAPTLASADTTGIADCSQTLPLEKAVYSDLVFVGRVSAATNGGRSAAVEVTDVWHGDLPASVMVDGGLNPAMGAEDDRAFEVGVTYLFILSIIDGRLIDSICSPTVPWTDDLAVLRPPDAHGPTVAPTSSGADPLAFLDDLAAPIGMAALFGGGAFLVALMVGRRRES